MGKNNKYYRENHSPQVTKEAPVISEPEEAKIEEPKVEETKFEDSLEVEVKGKVVNVSNGLNIRETHEVLPNNQIAIAGKDDVLTIINPTETFQGNGEEWYKIKLWNGEIGYAMKKFIALV